LMPQSADYILRIKIWRGIRFAAVLGHMIAIAGIS
jgi:hypothetical protein